MTDGVLHFQEKQRECFTVSLTINWDSSKNICLYGIYNEKMLKEIDSFLLAAMVNEWKQNLHYKVEQKKKN